MDERSVDTDGGGGGAVQCLDVDIRFSNERERLVYDNVGGGWVVWDGGRVRDGEGGLFMVLEVRVDRGEGVRGGKAWGKLLREGGVEEGGVGLTVEEGLRLGCRMEVLTEEERSEWARDRLRLWALQEELVAVSVFFVIGFWFWLGL